MQYAYIGCWCEDITSAPDSSGEDGGIKAYVVDDDGKFHFVNKDGLDVNVGIIAVSNDGKFMYTNDERKDFGGVGKGGGIAAFKRDDKTGAITFINEVPSGDAYPNYVVTDKKGRYVFAGHHGHHFDVITKSFRCEDGTFEGRCVYDEASVAMYPILEDGSVGRCCDLQILTGSSINPMGQRSAHSHSVRLDPTDTFLLSCNKGADQIDVFRIDYESGKLNRVFTLDTERGMQPRHMVFHPTLPILYVCAEAGGFVCAYKFDFETGALELFDRQLSVPAEYEKAAGPADIKIHCSGRFLYVSNRRHDTIGCFRLDDEGKMTLFDCVPCGSSNPRGMDFDLSGDVLYVANLAGCVVPFEVDTTTGELHHTDYRILQKTPLYIQFVEY